MAAVQLSHFPSSGGTLVAKCLGVMPGVVLLSEIHPLVENRPQFHPRLQLRQWYPEIFSCLQSEFAGSQGVVQDLRLIAGHCNKLGLHLVVREWTYFDWLAPDSRQFSSRLREALPADFFGTQLVSLRHPLDNWLSFDASGFSRKVGASAFFEGYLRFIQQDWSIPGTLVMSYDQLVRDPANVLALVGEHLGVACNEGILARAPAYDRITGESGRSQGAIAPRPRRNLDASKLAILERSTLYRACVERFETLWIQESGGQPSNSQGCHSQSSES